MKYRSGRIDLTADRGSHQNPVGHFDPISYVPINLHGQFLMYREAFVEKHLVKLKPDENFEVECQ